MVQLDRVVHRVGTDALVHPIRNTADRVVLRFALDARGHPTRTVGVACESPFVQHTARHGNVGVLPDEFVWAHLSVTEPSVESEGRHI